MLLARDGTSCPSPRRALFSPRNVPNNDRFTGGGKIHGGAQREPESTVFACIMAVLRCALPYSPSPSPPCFCRHKLGNRREVRLCSSAGNLVAAGCSRGMQIRAGFLSCPEPGALAPSPHGEAGSGDLHARRRPPRPGHRHSSWLSPTEANPAEGGPPVARSRRTRSRVGSATGGPRQLLPLREGTGRISAFV